MEKHKCKLCFKSFANGSALGGHMRSHMMNLPIQSKSQYQPIREITPSSSSSASEDDDKNHEHEQEKGSLNYGLRENPKKSFRLSDPGFAFVSTSSVVFMDRESETESQKNSTRRRSKRIRRSNITVHNYYQQHFQEDEEIKKSKCMKIGQGLVSADQEPVLSSVSDTTTEEDLAFCLMMLSRDEWEKTKIDDHHDQEFDEYSYDSDEIKLCKTVRNRAGKYKCETCNKVFKSYQALGGHRASHKKNRLTSTTTNITSSKMEIGSMKIHECPYCYRVFSSGQALGGHKRTHLIGSSSSSTIVKKASKFGDVLIDLNLPAQVEDDTDEYFEVSAVSD